MTTTLTITALWVDEHGYEACGAYYGAGQNGCIWTLEGVFGTRSGFTPHRLNRDTKAEAARDGLATLPARHRCPKVEIIDATDEADLVSERGER